MRVWTLNIKVQLSIVYPWLYCEPAVKSRCRKEAKLAGILQQTDWYPSCCDSGYATSWRKQGYTRVTAYSKAADHFKILHSIVGIFKLVQSNGKDENSVTCSADLNVYILQFLLTFTSGSLSIVNLFSWRNVSQQCSLTACLLVLSEH